MVLHTSPHAATAVVHSPSPFKVSWLVLALENVLYQKRAVAVSLHEGV